MSDIYEVTPEEVREDATPVFGRLHPDDYDRVSADIMRSARTLDDVLLRVPGRPASPGPALASGRRPTRCAPEDGGTLWHGIISDITERKLAEEEIHRQAEQLRRTVQGAVLGDESRGRDARPLHGGPRAPGRRAGGGHRRRDGSRRRRTRGAAPRIAHPRHRQDRRARRDPRQAGASPPTSSSTSSASIRPPASTSSRRSTSARRWRSSCCSTTSAWTAPATRAGSPATRSCRGAHHRRGRCRRGDVVASPVSRRPRPGRGARRGARSRGRDVRRRRRCRLRAPVR